MREDDNNTVLYAVQKAIKYTFTTATGPLLEGLFTPISYLTTVTHVAAGKFVATKDRPLVCFSCFVPFYVLVDTVQYFGFGYQFDAA